jgi:hypothetical protein
MLAEYLKLFENSESFVLRSNRALIEWSARLATTSNIDEAEKLKAEVEKVIFLYNRTEHFNKCSNTNIYSYLETSGGQTFNLYLSVIRFFNTSVNWTSRSIRLFVPFRKDSLVTGVIE